MASFYDNASLVMIPSGYKDDKLYSIKPTDGSGDFTFSRDGAGASPATRVNASGLIEKGRTNLLLQSNSFDTTWTNVNTTETSGQSGYDGTNDAWLLTKSAASARIEQSVSQSGVLTFSAYAKAGTLNWIRLNVDTAWAYYDLGNGVVGSDYNNIIDHNIYNVGGGWYRCELVVNLTASVCRIYPGQGDGNVSGTSGNIYIQDAQLEQGLVATDYIETTTAPVSAGLLGDMPRLDYSGGATCPSLLLEPSRVNVVEYAEYFDIYTKSNATITNNSDQSPEGLQNASSLAGNGATSSHYIFRNSGTAVSGTDYTISFFAKSGSLDYVQLVMGSGAFGVMHQNFDLSNGTIGSSSGSVTPFIESYANNWYRVGVTITATASTTITPFIALANSSTMLRLASFATSDDVKIYGLQVESGSYPTSYIPTYGSAATRGKDASSVTGVSSLIGSTEGTIYLEVSALANDLSERRFALSNGTTGNVARVGFTNVDNRILAVLYNGANQCVLTYAGADITQTNKIAFTYAENDFALYVNGQSRSTDVFGVTFSAGTFSEIHFNEGDGNGNESYGRFDQVVIFPTRLTNAELAALTA